MERKKIFWLVAVSLILRLTFVLSLPPHLKFDDEFEYWRVAENFLSGHGLVVNENWKAFRPPLYPLIISVLMACRGNLLAIRIFQAVVSTATVVFIFWLGKRVFSSQVGQLAGWFSCGYPFFIFYTGFLLTETVFIFLIVWSLWELVVMTEAPDAFRAVRAGLALGLAGLCRPTMQAFVPLALLLVWLSRQRKWQEIKLLAITAVLFGLVLLPWVIRNYLLLGRFVPGTTMGGWVFWEGNNLHSEGGPCRIFPEEVGKISEGERDKFLYRETMKVIRENPRRYLWLLQNKFKRFWNVVPNAKEFVKPLYRAVSVFSFGVLVPFFVLGFWVSLAQRKAWLLHGVIIFFTLFHVIYLASIRYRVAVEPFVIIFSANGWFYLVALVRETVKLRKKQTIRWAGE
ncbi:MAG TPA: glycosyltransferase family 39 protein [bacterium]|nr:glycosyltransferase family 39 protein [bacterium]